MPASFTVNNAAELATAVALANAGGPGLNTITLNPGRYFLTAELDVTSNISFQGAGTSPFGVVVDGQNAVRDFNITADALNVSWSNLTITGGNAANGGGVRAGVDDLAFNNVIVNENNASGIGGGIDQAGGGLAMTNSQVSSNTAGSSGGGYENEGEITDVPGSVQVTNSSIDDNFAGTFGGGMYAANTVGVVLTGSHVDGNTAASKGGGVVLDSDTGGVSLTMNSSTIDNNNAYDPHDGDAGGVNIASVASGSASTIVLNSSHIDGNTCTDDGGGIDAEDMAGDITITLTNSTVNNNTATGPHTRLDGSINNAYGGGINMEMDDGFTGALTLMSSSVSGNSSQFAGGVHLDAGLSGAASISVLNNSHVDNNRAVMGGGIDLHGDAVGGSILSATVDHSSVTGNFVSQDGGGIAAHTFGDALTINVSVIFSTINGNSAGGNGGGILATTVNAASNVNISVTNSTVAGNHAASGGGIYDSATGNATVTLMQSTVSSNAASGPGGGLYLGNAGGGTSVFGNDTISDNIAGTSGGGFHIDSNTNNTHLLNLTIAANWAQTGTGGGIQNNAGTHVSLGNSIIALNSAGAAHTPGDLIGTFDYFASLTPPGAPNIASSAASVAGSNFNDAPFNIFGNPQLGALANNGGPTQTMFPASGSPAIAAGNNNLASGLTTDQRGYAPRIPQGGTVDLGAVQTTAVSQALIATGADAGGGPIVSIFNAQTHKLLRSFFAYDQTFTGGVRVALGDVNGDGTPDLITAPGPGGSPFIEVFDGSTGQLIRGFFAYDASFTGGVNVAAGDVNDDGDADIICAPDAGGGPFVRVFSGKDGSILNEFYAYDANFSGGVRVAAGDVDGDNFADIISAPGAGGGPYVTVHSGKDGSLLAGFYAYGVDFTAGVYVTAADVMGAGRAQVITGAGAGGGPVLSVFQIDNGTAVSLLTFFPYDASFTGGVRVAAVADDGSGSAEIITGPGPGGSPDLRTFDATGQQVDEFFALDPHFMGGIYVAAG